VTAAFEQAADEQMQRNPTGVTNVVIFWWIFAGWSAGW